MAKKIDYEYITLLATRTFGNALILVSLLIIGKIFGPALSQEVQFGYKQLRGVKTVVASPSRPAPTILPQRPNAFASALQSLQQTQEVITPIDTQFSVVIPKISANSRVVKNVDAANYDEYIAALKVGVAHARGTALPGDRGHMYLFAHSTDNFFNVGAYNAVFYLLYKLEKDDAIYIFYNGKKFAYRVTETRIINPDELEYLTRDSSEPFLTLQTCWPPGTTLKRLLVFAQPVVE
ncbi:MAG: sortase [Candidatus Roizmanbacteria bacterium]|nr:sortase [Candidatus Roizmanbacteria bacterium]